MRWLYLVQIEISILFFLSDSISCMLLKNLPKGRLPTEYYVIIVHQLVSLCCCKEINRKNVLRDHLKEERDRKCYGS